MINKAVIYARLSREDEDKIDGNKKESRSIENQIKFLTSYAEKNGLTVTKIYYDDGVSGGTFDRPAFNEMIKDMKRKKFNIIKNYFLASKYHALFLIKYFPKLIYILYLKFLDLGLILLYLHYLDYLSHFVH